MSAPPPCTHYHGPCRRSHDGRLLDDFRRSWSGVRLVPLVPLTVIAEHDPGRPRLVLQPGDLVEAVGRGVDPSLCWAWDWLWVLTGPHAGTCVFTERHGYREDEPTPGFTSRGASS